MNAPPAYCFFRDLEPQEPTDLRFERDYLLHVVKGALDVRVGARRWLLPRSFAAWLPAGTDFAVGFGAPVTSCSVLTRPGFCPDMPDRPAAFQMTPLTRQMALHCRDWTADVPHPPQAERFFRAFLDTCAPLIERSIDTSRPTSADPALTKALEAIEAGLAHPLEAGDIARAAGLSERTMQRRFAEELGSTFSEVVTRLRMIRAVALLADGDDKILSIAQESGFSSLSAFNRAFRRFTGTTPTAFRRGLR